MRNEFETSFHFFPQHIFSNRTNRCDDSLMAQSDDGMRFSEQRWKRGRQTERNRRWKQGQVHEVEMEVEVGRGCSLTGDGGRWRGSCAVNGVCPSEEGPSENPWRRKVQPLMEVINPTFSPSHSKGSERRLVQTFLVRGSTLEQKQNPSFSLAKVLRSFFSSIQTFLTTHFSSEREALRNW